MKKEIFKPDKTNSIELRSIYNIGVGIAKSLINLQNEEIFLWYEYHYGPWPLDKKRKEIKSILKSSNEEKVLQPWFKRLSKEKDFKIIKSEEIVNQQHKWFRTKETLHTLSDQTQILYKEQAGIGGSEREWRIISTGRFFNRISYDISLPIFDGIEQQAENLGKVICIKEPSYSQRQNVISYDVIFEKDSTMSQISISLFPDQSFRNLYVLSYFGECTDIDDAEKYDYVKHIHTEAENIYLSKYRKTTMTEERF